jgi:hypothetical protein
MSFFIVVVLLLSHGFHELLYVSVTPHELLCAVPESPLLRRIMGDSERIQHAERGRGFIVPEDDRTVLCMAVKPGVVDAEQCAPRRCELMAPGQIAVGAIKSAGRMIRGIPREFALPVADAVNRVHIPAVTKQGRH